MTPDSPETLTRRSLDPVVGRAVERETNMSNRKPHNKDAGYVAEKIFRPTGAHVVIYVAAAQGIDVDGNRYAVVCSKHSTICGVQSVPKARVLMKYPEFCERCMAEERSTPNAKLSDSASTTQDSNRSPKI